jgi:hypothetical protein
LGFRRVARPVVIKDLVAMVAQVISQRNDSHAMSQNDQDLNVPESEG